MTIDPQQDPTVECAFCGKSRPMSHAVADAWEPEWWVTDKIAGQGPACRDCADAHLDLDDDGEMTLKPGHEPFIRQS